MVLVAGYHVMESSPALASLLGFCSVSYECLGIGQWLMTAPTDWNPVLPIWRAERHPRNEAGGYDAPEEFVRTLESRAGSPATSSRPSAPGDGWCMMPVKAEREAPLPHLNVVFSRHL